jgi:serine/threonine-protein kinase
MRDDQHGTVPLRDAYLEGKTPWLAYEYVDESDLSTIVRQHAELGPEKPGQRVLQYLIALAEVIGRFHTLPRPVVHRDLKPANILLKRQERILLLRVTDFGISHIEADRGIRQATISTPQMSRGATFRGA